MKKKILQGLAILLLGITTVKAQTVIAAWGALSFPPDDIAIDASGNVYAVNNNINYISKITSAGIVTNQWAALQVGASPRSIVVDASGNIYTGNYNTKTISKITQAGIVTQTWATLAASGYPRDIAIDASGNVFTINDVINTVSKITAAGVVTQTWASLPLGASATGIAIDALSNVYTANNQLSTVSKITSAGAITQAWATLSNSPWKIAISASGIVYTANALGSTVSKITPTALITQSWATLYQGVLDPDPMAADPYITPPANPYDIVVDATENVYTANYGNNTISKITAAGVLADPWVTLDNTNPKPYSLVHDASGSIYTGNQGNSTVSKITTSILPLKWLNVSGNLNTQKQATINWQVQETNVANYVIEKSTDGRTFTNIGNVISKGDGTNNYNYTNASILNGTGYYRIKQIDRDGRTSYSTIIKLITYNSSLITIYPNPVKDVVSISGATIGNKATLTDISGKQLLQLNITQTAFTIDMSAYNSGVYILKTDNGVTQKIIKE